MAETSRPWTGTSPGDAGAYSAAQWQALHQNLIGLGASRPNVGVLLGTGTQPTEPLRVQAQGTPSTSVDILAGSAMVQGIGYFNSATVSKTIAANASGNPRIDTIILRADYALQTVRLAVLQGTPAASPVAPSLTQSANVMWEIPLADIAVANGFVSITNANITRRYEYANATDGVYLDSILNNSGATLEDGDVVIWDVSADRAVMVGTTLDDPLLAGVWRGRTAAGGYGRIQVRGIGYVNASAAVTRGDILVSSGTTKRAVTTTTPVLFAILGQALETTSGSGYVLTEIKVQRFFQPTGFLPFAAAPSYNATFGFGGASTTLAAVSGTLLIPVILPGPMLLQSVQLQNNDAASARQWQWCLYRDDRNNANAIARVAQSNGVDAFTPGAASIRTLAASGAPVFLPAGVYYLAIQNTHASNTFAVGALAGSVGMPQTQAKTKTTGGTNGATLDIVAATWTAITAVNGVVLRGRAAGDTVAW